MEVTYDLRFVPAHDNKINGKVLLMNEAPGPEEAASGIPLYGQQGANLFHALRAAGVKWAINYERFTWPRNDYTNDTDRQFRKMSFLATRPKYITCTNSYPYWPKPKGDPNRFCPPRKHDVCQKENIERIKNEITPTHSTLLVCGCCAYLACVGVELSDAAKREYTVLTAEEIDKINTRLDSQFKRGWYMGHTRRWSMNRQHSSKTLRDLAQFLHWALSDRNL